MKLAYMLDHMPEAIEKRLSHRIFYPGEVIVNKGERVTNVYLITHGTMRVSTEFSNGQRFIFSSLEIPDLICDLEVLADQKFCAATCEAVTTCEVIVMTISTFWEWLQTDNEFAVAVAKLLAAKMFPTSSEVSRIKFLPSHERLHNYLLKKLGKLDTDLFILHTGRQEIADHIGTSVKTVNRCVTKLKEAGLISLLHGKIAISREQQRLLRETFVATEIDSNEK